MSMSDPIADLLTRIRNSQAVKKKQIEIPASKIKAAIAKILQKEGYITSYSVSEGIKPILTIILKYYNGKPIISEIKRVSRPGLRVYKTRDDLPKVLGGLGIAIMSTSKGLMTGRKAYSTGHGGEWLCFVS
ncbi:30S ribosomal protein S8 [Candidatus Parabeggiatoa sp. HSG14]|uniref:30S ribosomal protein S8 n=1 Tax=Candidatus Parabeggiatoa sp. HSG14 TaxID=3055593 RepID=UPI0025A71055|nr:30S ribosomal protein S8 [Thiotrichales bacterium HSG14]